MSNESKNNKGHLKLRTKGYPDEEYFNRLVLENQEKIYTLFRRMVASHEDADDLTQETFIKVYKNIAKFRQDSSVYTWIYRIAINTGINYLRRKRARQFVGLDAVNLHTEDHSTTDLREAGSLLNKAIRNLSSRQQMVIILRSYQGLSFKEIAKLMDSNENAAKVNYSHALKRLRTIFERMGINYENLQED
jgi:RNA polymerase sigma factor (sigma-70 family)